MMAEGLTTLQSRHSYSKTVTNLETAILEKGLTIFARIDHAAGAKAAALVLRPTLLLIFGNAKGGTPLMQEMQTIGIDLPLKLLVWESEDRNCWISYNDPAWIAARHGLSEDPRAADLSKVLRLVATAGCA
jgi:uncharacterized protein (DUF302 family)